MRITKGKNVTVAERDLVKRLIRECLKEIVKSKWEINGLTYKRLTVADVCKKVHFRVKCKGQRSFAWKSNISIDVSRYRRGELFENEYDRIKNDPIIGEGTFATPEQALMVIVAHEVAHLIHLNYWNTTRWLRNGDQSTHGKNWQKIYRILRRELVNKQGEIKCGV